MFNLHLSPPTHNVFLMTQGSQYLHNPLVCFELESRDVDMGIFFDSDSTYDPLLVTALR